MTEPRGERDLVRPSRVDAAHQSYDAARAPRVGRFHDEWTIGTTRERLEHAPARDGRVPRHRNPARGQAVHHREPVGGKVRRLE